MMALPLYMRVSLSEIKHLKPIIEKAGFRTPCPARWQRPGFATTSAGCEEDAQPAISSLSVSLHAHSNVICLYHCYRPDLPVPVEMGEEESTE